MDDIEDDFARLGLNPDANVQDVRRAYARELKKIDQANDGAGFQALRLAYEWALQYAGRLNPPLPQEPGPGNAWLELSGSDGYPAQPAPVAERPQAPAAAPPSALASGPAPGEQSHQFASTAFAQLLAASAQLAQAGQEQDQAAWSALLTEQLASAPLIDLTARDGFEAKVVAALTGHWRDGNEALFAAATHVFGWSDEYRLAQRFGPGGALIQQALDEQQLFGRVAPIEQAVQRAVLARLRDPREPTREEFRRDRFHIERLVTRYPAMLALMVDRQRLQYWRAGYSDMPGMPRASRYYDADPAMATWRSRRNALRADWPIAAAAAEVVLAILTAAAVWSCILSDRF